MKARVWTTTGALLLVVAAIGLGLGRVGTAHASHLDVTVAESTPAIVGQASELQATVTSADAGLPAGGVPVTFYAHATFGKASGYVEIGRTVTDANGVATINYVPRESGTHDIRVDYAQTGNTATEQTTTSVAVGGSPSQLYVQKAGVQVPGLSSWLIIVVLSIVWAILFGVGLTLIRIAARSGRPAESTLTEGAAAHREKTLGAGAIG
jgi:hypothetical protein